MNFLLNALRALIGLMTFIVVWMVGFYLINLMHAVIYKSFPDLSGMYIMTNLLIIVWSIGVVCGAVFAICEFVKAYDEVK